MKKLFVVFISANVLLSCSNEQPLKAEEKVESSAIPTFDKPVVDPTKLLTIQIGGMSCEMGCGGAIRKELYATNAVDEITYDFKMGRDFNEATISFDDSKINDEKIIEIIQTINKNQFSVKEASVTSITSTEKDSNKSSANSASVTHKNSSLGDKNIVANIGQSIVGLIVKSLFRR